MDNKPNYFTDKNKEFPSKENENKNMEETRNSIEEIDNLKLMFQNYINEQENEQNKFKLKLENLVLELINEFDLKLEQIKN